MNWLKRLFGIKEKSKPAEDTLDMRVTPVDNPFDYREDGSIREGDPAMAAMMESLRTGKPMIGNQRPDGTWDVQFLDGK